MKKQQGRKPQQTPQPSNNGAEPFKAGPPDYFLWAVDKKTGISGDIGAGWINADGSIRIKLNAFVVLDAGATEYTIRMYPKDRK